MPRALAYKLPEIYNKNKDSFIVPWFYLNINLSIFHIRLLEYDSSSSYDIPIGSVEGISSENLVTYSFFLRYTKKLHYTSIYDVDRHQRSYQSSRS